MIGCGSVSSQMISATMPITATTASVTITHEPNQPRSLPLSSMICRLPTPTTSRASPILSTGSTKVSVSRWRRIGQPAHSTRMPIGTLMKKIPLQCQLSEIQPPRIGPKIGATTTVIAHSASASPCLSRG